MNENQRLKELKERLTIEFNEIWSEFVEDISITITIHKVQHKLK